MDEAESGVPVGLGNSGGLGDSGVRAKRGSLRFKFLSINLTIVLATTVVLFGLWEITFYRSANQQLEQKLDEVVNIQSEILAIPVWNLETDRIQLILEAIRRDADFVMAIVTDERGYELVRSGQALGGDLHTTSSSILYDAGGGGQMIGELTLVADRKRILGQARTRVLLDLIMVVVLMTAALIAALTAFRRTIDQPLNKLLQGINRAKSDRTREAVQWHSNDEIGAVISQFNDMQARQAGYQAELEKARDHLEERVRGRTAELSDARDQANAANRAKSDFLAVMSHELRTPLNGVLGLSDIVLDAPLSAEQRRSIGLIKDSGMTLLGLLDDILDLSKIEAGRIELENLTFDLDRLLVRIREFWAPIAEAKGLTFRLETPEPGLGVIVTDPSRLRQILFNLLNNALKFTEDGQIVLRVSSRSSSEPTEGNSSSDRASDLTTDQIRFEVIDQGIGVPEDAQDKLFAKFTQADSSTTRRFGGTGLGLTICKELAALMGGRIGVTSSPGRGSTFWFTIRHQAGHPSQVCEDVWDEDPVPLSPSASPGRLKILGAEDNHINQVLLSALVEKMGHELEIVDNGAKAVEAMCGGHYDLVLMDVQMPELDGESATRLIRALPGSAARVPIIALTANAMRGDRERYLACGMNGYVSKPIKPQALQMAIHSCLGRGAAVPDAPVEALGSVVPAAPTDPNLDPAAARALLSLVEDLDQFEAG